MSDPIELKGLPMAQCTYPVPRMGDRKEMDAAMECRDGIKAVKADEEKQGAKCKVYMQTFATNERPVTVLSLICEGTTQVTARDKNRPKGISNSTLLKPDLDWLKQ